MSSSGYDVFEEGNVIWFQMQFIDSLTNEPVNPTAVYFGYRVNGGEITSIQYPGGGFLNPETGTFLVPIPSLGLAGTWVWQWQSTGTGAASRKGSIKVTPLAMDLAG
jgi:hypothetical protein